MDNSLLSKAARAPGSYTQSALAPLKGQLSFDTQTGIGYRTIEAGAAPTPATTPSNTFTEECTVYSELLVMEAGVFELPTGWPDTNTYDGFTIADADLPELGAAYVLQRRTHSFVYSDGDGKPYVDRLLAVYAKPFAYAGQPIYPLVKDYFKPVTKATVSAKVKAANNKDAPIINAVGIEVGLYGASVV